MRGSYGYPGLTGRRLSMRRKFVLTAALSAIVVLLIMLTICFIQLAIQVKAAHAEDSFYPQPDGSYHEKENYNGEEESESEE